MFSNVFFQHSNELNKNIRENEWKKAVKSAEWTR